MRFNCLLVAVFVLIGLWSLLLHSRFLSPYDALIRESSHGCCASVLGGGHLELWKLTEHWLAVRISHASCLLVSLFIYNRLVSLSGYFHNVHYLLFEYSSKCRTIWMNIIWLADTCGGASKVEFLSTCSASKAKQWTHNSLLQQPIELASQTHWECGRTKWCCHQFLQAYPLTAPSEDRHEPPLWTWTG